MDLEADSNLKHVDCGNLSSRPYYTKYASSGAFAKWILGCAAVVIGLTYIINPFFRAGTIGVGQAPEAETMCPVTEHKATLSFEFKDAKHMTFEQVVKGDYGNQVLAPRLVHTVGQINVRPAKEDSESSVQVDLDIRGSDPKLIGSEALSIGKTGSALTVKTPRQIPRDLVGANTSPCIHISATMWIPQGIKLDDLGISTESLSVVFHNGQDQATQKCRGILAYFTSSAHEADKSRSISIHSRETTIAVDSGSVTGSYNLYDLLSISTKSGSIDVKVDPKNASEDKVKPAILELTSNSGSIRASTSTVSVPDRDFQTSISSNSGGIDATLIHGLRTSLRSNNGHINADLFPYGHEDSRTDISTHSNSGSTDIKVHSSISHPCAPLKKLYATYHCSSGSLRLWYPAQWQGSVEGTILSGSIHLDWQGLRIVKDEKEGWVKRKIEAVRGEGEGRLVFSQDSGSVALSGESGGVEAQGVMVGK